MPDVSKGLTYVENPVPIQKPVFHIYGVWVDSPPMRVGESPRGALWSGRFWANEEGAAEFAKEQRLLGVSAVVNKIGVY